MKKAIFIKTLVLSAIVCLSCAAKAQSDTAWMDTNYIDQYIFPPLLDERWEDEYRYGWYSEAANGVSYIICERDEQGIKTPADYIAQKYEAEDSITLAGVAVLMEGWRSPFDSLAVEIWDDALSTVLLSKTFICEESQEHLFYECMFNEPITLFNDYYVSVRLYRCVDNPNENIQEYDRLTHHFISVLKLREFHYDATDVPQGCNIKYEPYFKLCDEDEWKRLDDINTWGLITEGLTAYNYFGNPDTRQLVFAPFGFDAMNRKVLETNANNDILNIDLSDFKPGTYFFIITTDKGTCSEKVIVG